MNTISLRFQNSTVWRAFSKTSASLAENAFYVWTGGVNGEKSLRFWKYSDICGRGLRVSFGAVFQAFLARPQKSWILQTFRFSRIQKVIIARSISTTLTSRLTAWQNCANSTLCWVNKPSKTSSLTVSENDVKAKWWMAWMAWMAWMGTSETCKALSSSTSLV